MDLIKMVRVGVVWYIVLASVLSTVMVSGCLPEKPIANGPVATQEPATVGIAAAGPTGAQPNIDMTAAPPTQAQPTAGGSTEAEATEAAMPVVGVPEGVVPCVGVNGCEADLRHGDGTVVTIQIPKQRNFVAQDLEIVTLAVGSLDDFPATPGVFTPTRLVMNFFVQDKSSQQAVTSFVEPMKVEVEYKDDPAITDPEKRTLARWDKENEVWVEIDGVENQTTSSGGILRFRTAEWPEDPLLAEGQGTT